jgi:Zn finger protein HypA/HybF involved in hydrogenase expression
MGEDFWEENSFAETMDAESFEKKKRTFHMSHDEEMNFSCKTCRAKISAHNKDWHAGLCGKCFNKMINK